MRGWSEAGDGAEMNSPDREIVTVGMVGPEEGTREHRDER